MNLKNSLSLKSGCFDKLSNRNIFRSLSSTKCVSKRALAVASIRSSIEELLSNRGRNRSSSNEVYRDEH
ncbi:hypothetical protein [Melioribacter sp. OK-1-Me]|uniref:hypothetical protein n=1 Tax=Melioribacter sp. OK-1-Me TaxID=3461410 RepID=UPI00404461B0